METNMRPLLPGAAPAHHSPAPLRRICVLSVELPSELRLGVSKYQNRSDFRNRPDVKPLFDGYRTKLLERGHLDLRGFPLLFERGADKRGLSSSFRPGR